MGLARRCRNHSTEQNGQLEDGDRFSLLVDAAVHPRPSDDNNIYLYGGTVSDVNANFPGYQKPPSSQYDLWSYDDRVILGINTK